MTSREQADMPVVRSRPIGAQRDGVAVIVPSVNRIVEQDWRWAWPAGETSHFVARARYVEGPDAPSRLCADAVRAAEDLGAAQPELGVFAYTAGGFASASSGNDALGRQLSLAMGCPVVTAASAVVEALQTVAATTVALAAPYPSAGVARAVDFLAERDFDVVSQCGMGIEDGFLESRVTPDEVQSFVLAHVAPESADALFISCTNLQSWRAVAALEQVLGMPVITSNQALVAAAVRRMGTGPPRGDVYGQVFEALREPADPRLLDGLVDGGSVDMTGTSRPPTAGMTLSRDSQSPGRRRMTGSE